MSQSGLTASIYVDMNGNITQVINRYNQNMNQLGQNTVRQAGLMNRAVSSVQSGLGLLNSNMVKFAAGGGLLMAGRGVSNHQKVMTQFRTDADLTVTQLKKFGDEIFRIGAKFGIPTDQLDQDVLKLVELTGDLDAAYKNIEMLGVARKGLGLDGSGEAGELLAFFQNTMKIYDPAESLNALNILKAHAAEGAVNPKDVARTAKGIGASWETKGSEGVAEISGMLQTGFKGFKSLDETVTGMKALNDGLNKPETKEFLKKQGVDVYDKDGKRNKLSDILGEINTKTLKGGHDEKGRFLNQGDLIKKLFPDKMAQEGAAPFMGTANASNIEQLAEFEKMTRIKEDKVTESAKINAATMDASMSKLSNAVSRFSEINLAGPIDRLADAINGIDMAKFDEYAKIGGEVIKSMGALMLAAKGYKLASSISSFARPLGGTGGGPGGLGGTVAVTPVFVTNMPVAGMGAPVPAPHGPPAPPGPQPVPPAPTRRQRYANMTLQATSVLIAGASAAAVGYQIGTVISDVMYRWSDAQNAKDKIAYDKRVKSTQEQHPDWKQDEVTDYAASNYNDPVAWKMNKDAMEAIAAKQDDPKMRTKMRARAFVLLRDGKTSDQFAEEMGEKKNDEAQVEKKGVQTRYLGGNTAAPSETTGSSWRGHKVANKNSDSGVSSMVDWAKGVMEEMQAQGSAVKTIQDVKPPEGTINVKITGLEKVGTNVSTTASGIVLKTNVGNTGTDLP